MISQSFSVSGPAELEISVSSGSVSIEAGLIGTVEVTVDTNHPDAWTLAQAGTAITVAHERGVIGRGARARVRVVTPPGSSLRLNSASAEVRSSVALDRVKASTASGDVILSDAGSVDIKTASGDVRVGAVERDLIVRSASGDVHATEVGQGGSTTTASGDVEIELADGLLSASSASGDLAVGTYLGSDLEASTMSGDLAVGLPAGRTVKLSANTLSGSVRLPDRRTPSTSGGEPVSVRLKSVSGDVTIRRVG